MKDFLKGAGFIIIGLGTLGLILNEFVFDSSTTLTLTFVGVDIIGLAFLAIGHYLVKEPG
jgi:hypothetical protein